MKAKRSGLVLAALVSLPLLVLRCDSTRGAAFHTTAGENTLTCHDDYMSISIPKEQFDNLPSTIYVGDGRGYYQVAAIAERCLYFLKETLSFIVLTVASTGCFVKRQKFTMSLVVVIVAPADEGPPRIIQSIRLICGRREKEPSTFNFPGESRQYFCNKNGFDITIPLVHPQNLQTFWVTSDRNPRCFPQQRSKDAVAFSFLFSECGTQFRIADGIITYWININVKPPSLNGVIFRQTPFQLTVQCSFALTQRARLDLTVEQTKSDFLSTLKNKGTLRTEMRFAKDSSYRSFYSSSSPPAAMVLGQPAFVEVFVVKHQNKDLTLLLEDCWATPTEDPHDPRTWDLIVKGCPFTGDNQRTVLLPVSSTETSNPALHKWFVVKLFSFVRSPTSEHQVYFHCNVEICKGPGCFHHCSDEKPKQRRIPPRTGQRILSSTVSSGPVLYQW